MASKRTKYRQLSKRLRAGELVRIANGVYAHPAELEGLEGDFYRATLLVGKNSAICLLSALQFYGLSEQMFGGTWILISYSHSKPRSRSIHAVRSRSPHFKTGIVSKGKFRITTIERTIVDAFRYKRLTGVSTAVDAMKKALSEGLTNREKLFLMAKKLGAYRQMLPYLEAL